MSVESLYIEQEVTQLIDPQQQITTDPQVVLTNEVSATTDPNDLGEVAGYQVRRKSNKTGYTLTDISTGEQDEVTFPKGYGYKKR